MKSVWIVSALLLVGLSGCSAQLEKDAISDAKSQCAAKGMKFVQTSSERHDNLIVSKASVSGRCVGPGDPEFVQPPPPPHS